MKRFAKLFIILAVLAALPSAALAAPVGKITHVEGSVDITAGDKVRTATLGEPVNAGEVLRAKSKAKAEVTFLDGNILRLAENTRVRVTDYQSGEGKSTTLDLFRGKTQNIVSGLAKNARYEVHTPTAVCGVRGTDFFAFYHNGASGFVPKEGTIYGYNRNSPREVRTVTPGQALMVPSASQPATIQPATTIEVDKHLSDTAPGGDKEKGEKDKDKDKKDKGGPSGVEGGMSQLIALPLEPPKEIAIETTNIEQTLGKDDWTFEVRGPGNVKLISKAYFPYGSYSTPSTSAATGTLLGVVDSKTFVGSVDMTLQYAPGKSPQLELGDVTGQMQDGSGFTGLVTSIPGSWMGAMSGIYASDIGIGMYLGYLEGSYNPDTRVLVSGGGLARTPLLGPTPTKMEDVSISPYLFEMLGLDAPGVSSVSVADKAGYPSYVSSGIVSADKFNFNVSSGPFAGTSENYLSYQYDAKGNYISSSLLSAWAVTQISNDGFSYSKGPSSPKIWAAKYGYSGYNIAVGAPYFIVGDVTGYEAGTGDVTDPTRLRLSGRNLLYITPGYNNFDPNQFTPQSEGGPFAYAVPGSMGYFNFELWNGGAYGYGGGAGTLELAPTLFGGYWGYDISRLNCMYYNDFGFSLHVADEWGLIGAWTAPWKAPADIKVAGTYQMDPGYGSVPGYLWGSPVGSRIEPGNAFYNEPTFADGDFFGRTAGRIGLYAQTAGGAWERNARGDLAAIYLKDGVAGLLTTFATGGWPLTGGFYPDATGEGGFWRLDGTLTAKPMTEENPTNISFSLQEEGFSVTMGYRGADSSTIRGYGESTTYYLNASDQNMETSSALPWGVYSLYIGGYEGDYSIPTATYSGKTAGLSGKEIKIGGVQRFGSTQAYWVGSLKNTVWTPTVAASTSVPESGQIFGVASGDFISATQYGTFTGPFYGLYDEDRAGAGYGSWIGEGVGTYEGAYLAFSSGISGYRYKAVPGVEGALTLSTPSTFDGVMGGLSGKLWTNQKSEVTLLGILGADDWVVSPATAPFVAASHIQSYIPETSTLTGGYDGFLGITADSTGIVSGGVRSLFFRPSSYGGVLYSDDIAGSYDRETGFWKGKGNVAVYEMTTSLSSSTITLREYEKSYAANGVKVNATLGGSVDPRQAIAAIQGFSGEPWGIWNSVAGGTYKDGTPRKWVSAEENTPLPASAWTGGTGSEYMSFNLDAPVNGVSSGNVAGAMARWGETATDQTTPRSYTVVVGGAVKGLFDPNTTPLTWTALSQGGFMKTDAFLTKQSGLTDIERANFERAMKIPAFDVGMANLRGNNDNLYVNMDNIKFFRFQTEANPAIWATKDVYGSYTTNPSVGTTVSLNSSSGLSGLTQTFKVQQWDTTNNNWGASIYNNGTTDTGGTLTRTETRTLPTGAAKKIEITEMRGAAAGTITPGVNSTASRGQSLPGPSSFSGTAAGTVR